MDTGAGAGVKGFTLHVLCPSLPSPNRFTFRGLPLSITVADLKVRISESIPSQPAPKSQKLLYLGKILADDNVTLQSLFGSLDVSATSSLLYSVLRANVDYPYRATRSQCISYFHLLPRSPQTQSSLLRVPQTLLMPSLIDRTKATIIHYMLSE